MKFSTALDRIVRTDLKVRRPWWHEYEFIFCADRAGFTPEPGCMEYYITRVGDRYDDIYPINTTLLKFPQLMVHGREGFAGIWYSNPNDLLATDWKACKNWRELNEKARERKKSSFPHSETILKPLTLENHKRNHSGVHYYDTNNK